ncbi:MAG TPA: hypothetical protein PLM56_04065 [Cyclobacteriaceae bacterium]|nr:hypothetical protein [Cytophagales bacterium]HRE65432.1 hypothetical protein [Cyclobacteriaceae bacterium]HRF32650.1 hypothetical protein [Cyclobacteriaceae bacterium]
MISLRLTAFGLAVLLFVSCGKKDNATQLPSDSETTTTAEVASVQPVPQRFSWPEYLAWKELMDQYYDTDLSGITDSTLLNDIASYDPVDMGWGDSNFADSVYASSVLTPQGKTNYVPHNVRDGKSTAWIEGADGAGEGEWVAFRFKKINPDEPLTSITIYNGFQLSETTYAKNSRAKVVRLYINDIALYDLYLEDTMKGQQFAVDIRTIDEQPVTLKFEIRATYNSTHYADTGFTEINFDGIWGGI